MGNQPEGVESFDERLKKNLSLFTGYKFLETSRGNSNDISALARQTPYLIESFKKSVDPGWKGSQFYLGR